MTGGATTRWARSFVDELARHGVREVVVAPGSRSTPLVMAFARDDRFRIRVHLDERSAGFFAVGVGKASRMPAAVVTTSGTAVANLFPAVVEACQGAVPLLVLTADRPHRLRDSDANQAIDQVHLFGRYVRAFFDAAPPTESGPALAHLRALAGRAVATTLEPSAGPVHVNFLFDKPLEPAAGDPDFDDMHPLPAGGRTGGAPFVRVARGRPAVDPTELDELAGLLAVERGVIVAGPASEPERVGGPVRELAAKTGFPLLADPLSGARFGPSLGADRIGAYDLFLADGEVADRLRPELILRIGASPTSAALQRWLERHLGVPHLVLDGERRWKDHSATATHYVVTDVANTLQALVDSATRSTAPEWSAAWSDAEHAAREAVAGADGEPYEGRVLSAVVGEAPAGCALFVSSSMPVRDLDAFGAPRDAELHVWGNRGASGIDGIVSTAHGVASQHDGPTVCVIGDIAFFHDQNGLLWSREPDAAVVFVLIDNDGGGIFHMLPIAEHEPHFTSLFATPHGMDFASSATLHGIPLTDATVDGAGRALGAALAEGGTRIVRVRTDRAASQARRAEVGVAATHAVRRALGID